MTDPEVLDAQALDRLREWGGDKLLAQMIRLFLENAPARMEQIRSGVGGDQVAEAEKGAHSLKSSAANIGAMSVRALAADAERAASAGDAALVASLLPALEDAFSRAISALESVERELGQ
jgi:HPt (histidine-containing phosphotransfer) domain-containing protein